ncbi:energy transducer TonB [Dyella sp.]|uniref:energy transducer TonB n=1 Tax=Dyella sp. TaxID=1869338 RepID=UPI003F80A16D
MHFNRLSYVLSGLMLCGVAVSSPAVAASAQEVARQAEASMVVVGTLTVAPNGSVSGYQLDNPENLPAAVSNLLQQAIPTWQFDPMVRDGKPVNVRSRMSLRVVLHPLGDKRYRLYLAGAYFSADNKPLKSDAPRRTQPRYPMQAIRDRVSGTVYLALKIDAQGHVMDAMVEQVNLRIAGDDHQMERYRRLLADPALEAARSWVFDPRMFAGAGDHYAMVPVSYVLNVGPGAGAHAMPGSPGHWDLYVPGPRYAVPWLNTAAMVAGSGDALPDDGVYLLNASSPHLRSKLSGS